MDRDARTPVYRVSLLKGLPIERLVIALEQKVDTDGANERLVAILVKLMKLSEDAHEGILLSERDGAELYVSFELGTAFYYIVDMDEIFPFGVVFDNEYCRNCFGELLVGKMFCEEAVSYLKDFFTEFRNGRYRFMLGESVLWIMHVFVMSEIKKLTDCGIHLSASQRRQLFQTLQSKIIPAQIEPTKETIPAVRRISVVPKYNIKVTELEHASRVKYFTPSNRKYHITKDSDAEYKIERKTFGTARGRAALKTMVTTKKKADPVPGLVAWWKSRENK